MAAWKREMIAQLPERYESEWREPLDSRIARLLAPGTRILEIGAGRSPLLPPDRRPRTSCYVALDIDRNELELAPAGSYDEIIVADVADRRTNLEGSFDVVISWNTLEHLKCLDVALRNVHSYLKPRGEFLTLFSGAFSWFALANRLLPIGLSAYMQHRLLGRNPDTVFPAHYDQCWYGRLTSLFAPWSFVTILPLYRGAGYFGFSARFERVYLAYENWAESGGHRNLATHYFVQARR